MSVSRCRKGGSKKKKEKVDKDAAVTKTPKTPKTSKPSAVLGNEPLPLRKVLAPPPTEQLMPMMPLAVPV